MTGRFKQALSEKKTPLWQRKEGKNPDGGLSVAGSKSAGVGRPVTKKPSKLKKGSKAANRRKSFCSRMGGMKKKLTSKKTASDPDSRINKALRKWNCSTDIVRGSRLALAEAVLKQAPNLRDRVRKAELQGTPRRIAIEDEKRAQDDARVKAAQGKNTVTKTFGKQGTQTSTTAYGGQAGSEEDRAKPMSKSQMDRAKGDEETISKKAQANQDAFNNLMKNLASRG